MGIRRLLVTAVVVCLAGAALALPVGAADGVTFTVTSTNDAGFFTLRKAILDSNGNGDAPAVDRIDFAISGNGPHTIALLSALPTITEPLIIDGYTQGDATLGTPDDDARTNDETGFSTNAALKIFLDGTGAATGSGLDIDTSDVVIRGLAVGNFDGAGISI